MSNNRLILNTDKTHLLIMTSAVNHRRHGNYGITLDTGAEIVEPDETEKLLGGLISNDLTWKENIRGNKESMFSIITNRVNALSKICRISDFKTRKMLANGIVMSKLIYLIQLWGGTHEYLLTFLQKLQNKAARLVTKLNWYTYTPVHVLLTQCGWLSIRQLVVYHDLIQVYKTMSTKRPTYFYNKFSGAPGAHTRLAASNGILYDKRIKSELAEKNFTNMAIKRWNELPGNIRMSTTLEKFKKSAKFWIKNNVEI